MLLEVELVGDGGNPFFSSTKNYYYNYNII